MLEEKRRVIIWNGSLLEGLSEASDKSISSIKNNVLDLSKILNIELPKKELRRMARKGYRSISIREEAFELLEVIRKLEKQPSISATVHHLSECYIESNNLRDFK